MSTVSACAATTYDATIASSSSTDVSVVVTVPTGTTEELLLGLTSALKGLSGLIGPDSSGRTPAGKNEQLDLIEALWDAVQSDVTAADPDAADSIGRMVALAQNAVERNRPADADKAARFAGQVIDTYLSAT
jgi:hypothetical protein